MIDIRWLRNTANAGRGAAMTDALHQATDEIERLRAALIAAMEIVQKDRLVLYRTALDPRTETVTDLYSLAALADYDRVIAQADAALGREA